MMCFVEAMLHGNAIIRLFVHTNDATRSDLSYRQKRRNRMEYYRLLAELAIFGKTPMKLPLAKRSFDLDLDIWLGNRKEPNIQMHVQWFH